MRTVVVLPYVLRRYRDECLATCKLDVYEVDNTEHNRGVMRSHNLGIDEMRRQDADWLVICSAAVRFGAEGGLDFVRGLERSAGQVTVCADGPRGVYGWHLFAFARETIEAVGRWDENFSPYGFDDNDMAIRVWKAFPRGTWGKILVDVDDRTVGMGHSVKEAGVRGDATAQLAYFGAKWGNPPGVPFEEYHDRPFDDPSHTVRYWPNPSSPPVLPEYLPAVKDGRWCEAATL